MKDLPVSTPNPRTLLADKLEQMMGYAKGTLCHQKSLIELGADSLVMVDLTRVIKEEFNVTVTLQQLFEQFASVEDIARFVVSQQEQAQIEDTAGNEACSPSAWSRPKALRGRPSDYAATFARSEVAFSLFYFGNYPAPYCESKYDLLFEGARFADQNSFEAVWVPERHFHSFAGFSPNPALLCAALARETKNIQLRAGSVVAPLHHPIRIAEEWSLVDNLSAGRAGLAFAAGWHPNDFVLAPQKFGQQRDAMFEIMASVQALWRGEAVAFPGVEGKTTTLKIVPEPKQKELPVWLTIVNNAETFVRAGEMGLNVITNLFGQSKQELADNLALYYQALRDNQHDPEAAKVTLMLHTFVASEQEQAHQVAKEPMMNYLAASAGLLDKMFRSQGMKIEIDKLSKEDLRYLLGQSYDRYIRDNALIGGTNRCQEITREFMAMGVSEIACFIDFGVPHEAAMASLRHLSEMRAALNGDRSESPRLASAAGQGKGRSADKALPPSASGENQAMVKYPATAAQQQLFSLAKLGQRAVAAYIETVAIRLVGTCQTELLTQALTAVVWRHPALRGRLTEEGFETLIVDEEPEVALEHVDLSHADSSRDAIADWTRATAAKSMDLRAGPLYRFSLLALAKDESILVLHFHHSVGDGKSWVVILNEVASIYNALIRGAAPELSESHRIETFRRDLDEYLRSSDAADDRAFWRDYLRGPLPIVSLPGDRTPSPTFGFHGARHVVKCDPLLRQALLDLGSQSKTTLFMLLFSIFQLMVQRLARVREALIAFPVAGRFPGSDNVVGYCTHLVPVVSRHDPEQSFLQYLANFRSELMKVFRHQKLPFSQLTQLGLLGQPEGRGMLLPLAFNLDRVAQLPDFAGLKARFESLPSPLARTECVLDIWDDGCELSMVWEYSTEHFSEELMQRYGQAFTSLCCGVVAQPLAPCGNISLLPPIERRRLLVDFQSRNAAPAATCFHDIVVETVLTHSERPALIDDRGQWSYSELNHRSNQLAAYLRSLGVGAGVVVAIYLPTCRQAYLSMLGVSMAGGAFLPLRVSDPTERIVEILKDAGCQLLISRGALLERFTDLPLQVIDISAVQAQPSVEPVAVSLRETAYVIYTSGSSGAPKGVRIAHQGLSAVAAEQKARFQLTPNDRVFALASLSFDLSIFEAILAWSAGAALICHGLPRLPLGRELVELINQWQASCLVATPTLWGSLPHEQIGDTVKQVLLGGEAVGPHHLTAKPAALRFHNMYGPTEVTIWATANSEVSAGNLSIGEPIAGVKLYILDESLEPVPVGVPGEIYLAGDGVGLGYLNRPELTARAFRQNPFGSGQIYATGDLGAWTDNGSVVFQQRRDRQIKVRGFRIEPAEIENHLRAIDGISNVCVFAQTQEDEARLAAAYVEDGAKRVEPCELRERLAESVPEYMVPTAFFCVKEIPLDRHQKMDLRALLRLLPSDDDTTTSRTNPNGDVERTLWQLWTEVLGNEPTSIIDNFFHLGGDSLAAARLIDRMRDRLSAEVTLEQFYQQPTILALAKEAGGAGAGLDTLVEKEEAYLQAELLDPGIGRNFGHNFDRSALQPIREVFLTGATGFVGAHLLVDLYRVFPGAIVTCLVRAENDGAAQARLWDVLARYRLEHQVAADRLRVCRGDLAANGLGLSCEWFEHVRESCDLIVHNGANVHHLHSFETLALVNSESTRECLKLAAEGRAKRLAYISTLTVVHSSYPVLEGETFVTKPASLYGGYAQSKWVSERLIAHARAQGMPVSIIRPGGIAGHSKTGISSSWESNHLLSLIAACLELKKSPDIDLELDVLPVDLVTQITAAILVTDEPNVYNLAHYPKMTWRDLMRWLDRHVGAVEVVPLDTWESEILPTLCSLHPFAPLKDLYQSGYLHRVEKWNKVTEFRNTAAVCKTHDLALPILYENHLSSWFGWLSHQGLLSRVRSEEKVKGAQDRRVEGELLNENSLTV